jgi:Vps16, C-terminal region
MQLQLEIGLSFQDLSITETIEKLLFLGHAAQASKVKYELGVSDLRYAHLCLTAIVTGQRWHELESFVKTYPKFPYKPIIDSIMKTDHLDVAVSYISMLGKNPTLKRDVQNYLERFPS